MDTWNGKHEIYEKCKGLSTPSESGSDVCRLFFDLFHFQLRFRSLWTSPSNDTNNGTWDLVEIIVIHKDGLVPSDRF